MWYLKLHKLLSGATTTKPLILITKGEKNGKETQGQRPPNNDTITSQTLAHFKKIARNKKNRKYSRLRYRKFGIVHQKQMKLFEEWRKYPTWKSEIFISSFGRVKKNGVIKEYLREYPTIYPIGLIHHAVAETFIGPNPGIFDIIVNHIDGDPSNNRADNLEYLTRKGNTVHAHYNKQKRFNYHRFLNYDPLKRYQLNYYRAQAETYYIIKQTNKTSLPLF